MSSSSDLFARLLNQYLDEHDRSAAWLARRIGVNRATVSRWLNAETAPRQADAVQDIAVALNLRDDELHALLHALDMAPGYAGLDPTPPLAIPAPNPNGNEPVPRYARPQSAPGTVAPLIGRDRELGAVSALLRDPDARLVTIVGPGGIGKTRLAGEAAWLSRAEFDEMVSLAFTDGHDDTGEQQFLHRVSDALGIAFDDGVPQIEQLFAFLRNRTVLLVLNSFEEALDARTALARLLRAADGLRVLVTSQEPLGLADEHTVALTGLACPPPGTHAAALGDYGAARLFVERVRQVTPVYGVDEHDAPAVVAICNAVAGFPLGILLAAGMYVDIPCVEIAALLEESPVLLHAAPKGIEPRHAKLDAVFLSAWQRTVPAAHRLLCALTLFQQGFTREDAQYLLGNDALQFEVDGHTEDGMAYLLKKSFLRFDRSAARYRMDPPLYHFVMGRRAEAADATREAMLRDRHADYFIARLRADAAAPPADPGEARFLAAWYDIRAALFRRLECAGTAAVVDDVNLACDFFDLRSRHQDVIDFLDEVLARAQAQKVELDTSPPSLWLFRKGEAFYKSGQLQESKGTLLATLDLLGEPTDVLRGERTRDPRIMPELFTQIRLRLLPDGLKRPPAHAANLELRARVFAILAQIFFFDDESVLTEYVVLRAANLAEQAGAPSELLARCMANLCVGLSLDPTTRGLAARYAHMSNRHANTLVHSTDARERAACAYVFVVLTLYEHAIGDLAAGRRHASLASQINRDLQKYRGYVESTTMEIAARELIGEHYTALTEWHALRELAAQRGDAQIQRWAWAGELENRLRLGTEDALGHPDVVDGASLAAVVDSLIASSRTDGDHSVLLNLHSLLVLVSLRHGLTERVFDDLVRLDAQLKVSDITKVTDFVGYTGAAEAAVKLLEEMINPAATSFGSPSAEVRRIAESTCVALDAYARVFPVARSRALTWRGLLHSINGDTAKAERCWRRSAEQAEALGLRFDQGLAHLEWGRHLPPGSNARQIQLARARAVFQAMNNAYLVGQVDDALG